MIRRVIAEQNIFFDDRIAIAQVFTHSEFKTTFSFVIIGRIEVISH